MPLVGAGKGTRERHVAQSTRMEMSCFVLRKKPSLRRGAGCVRVGVQEQPWMPGKISFVHLISGKSDLHVSCLLV